MVSMSRLAPQASKGSLKPRGACIAARAARAARNERAFS
jgi:hypothetical protein